ncbi:MAG: (5-formylfuran-3-yl)methyl phosphate synthase [Burkholderiaceae bacterium]|nr:(5-formylfuran-3-yl)methyl phosphate synthase [Burkholderiaceae bacterium]
MNGAVAAAPGGDRLRAALGGPAPRALVSVRDLDEARLAAAAGVALVDLKEPAEGALGGLDPRRIAAIVAALRVRAPATPVSATIGDWPAEALDAIEARVRQVAASGVDAVKVGVVPGPAAAALVQALGRLAREGLPLVPVLLADAGLPEALWQRCLDKDFTAVMLDTADKSAGSLLQCIDPDRLQPLLAQARRRGLCTGLAGALRQEDLPTLQRLQPDFAGFRSAVCAGDRRGQLEVRRLHALLRALAAAPVVAPPGLAPA